MTPRPSQHVILSCVAFFAFFIPCMFLLPQIFQEDLGVSNYGVTPSTEPLYFLGFLSSAAFLLFASYGLLRGNALARKAGFGLLLVTLLQLTLLSIPDSHNDSIRHAHVGVGLTLFMAEFLLAAWLAARAGGGTVSWVLLAVQALLGISAFLSLGHVLEFEAQSQLLFQLCFMALCASGIRILEAN